MAGSSIIDFATYRQFHTAKRTGAEALEEFALTTCEEAFLHRDWQRFAYWHRVYCHIRKPVKAGNGPSDAPRRRRRQRCREQRCSAGAGTEAKYRDHRHIGRCLSELQRLRLTVLPERRDASLAAASPTSLR